MLGEDRGVYVVVDEDRKPERVAHHVPDRDVDQRQVHRHDRDAGPLVDRAGDPEPGRGDVRARGPGVRELPLERVEHLPRAAPAGRLGAAVEDPLLAVDYRDAHFRPAEVDADRLDRAQRGRNSHRSMRQY